MHKAAGERDLYPGAEGPEGAAVGSSSGRREVGVVAAGARGEPQVFGRVDPVSPIAVLGGRFQYVGCVVK